MYSGINWVGWILLGLFFFGTIFILLLLFGSGAIIWIAVFIGACILGLISGMQVEQPIEKERETEFTTEDFMHCKIGEWVSRK